jgi:hypothetical protein
VNISLSVFRDVPRTFLLTTGKKIHEERVTPILVNCRRVAEMFVCTCVLMCWGRADSNFTGRL